jgi:hypothetical protein
MLEKEKKDKLFMGVRIESSLYKGIIAYCNKMIKKRDYSYSIFCRESWKEKIERDK